MVKYTLYYFDARARAETTRMVFAAAGVPFEDKRLDFEKGWPEFKPKSPTEKMPVLEVDGQMIPESMAIARFVARETGLYGKTSLDQARGDAVVDVLTEIRDATLPIFFAKDDKKKDLMCTQQDKIDKNFALVEKKLKHKKDANSFLIGDSVTLADLHFFSVAELAQKIQPKALDAFPALQGLEKRVAALPRMATYLKNRKDAPF